jgi:hypothetical protein
MPAFLSKRRSERFTLFVDACSGTPSREVKKTLSPARGRRSVTRQ